MTDAYSTITILSYEIVKLGKYYHYTIVWAGQTMRTTDYKWTTYVMGWT